MIIGSIKTRIKLASIQTWNLIHSKELHVPLFTTLDDIEEAQDIYFIDHTAMSSDDSCSDCEEPSYGPQQFNQYEFNDLV